MYMNIFISAGAPFCGESNWAGTVYGSMFSVGVMLHHVRRG